MVHHIRIAFGSRASCRESSHATLPLLGPMPLCDENPVTFISTRQQVVTTPLVIYIDCRETCRLMIDQIILWYYHCNQVSCFNSTCRRTRTPSTRRPQRRPTSSRRTGHVVVVDVCLDRLHDVTLRDVTWQLDRHLSVYTISLILHWVYRSDSLWVAAV